MILFTNSAPAYKMDYTYYIHSGKAWDKSEDDALIKEYETMDINKIGIIHKRTPGGIAYRLQTLGIIPLRFNAKGYDEYIKIKLYQEIKSSSIDIGKQNRNESKKLKRKVELQKTELETVINNQQQIIY